MDDKPFLPSRFFELNDQKSAQSLAQIYENEYTANANGTGVDDRDGRLKKEHEEIEKSWDNICYKLDALSNAHFTPKQASRFDLVFPSDRQTHSPPIAKSDYIHCFKCCGHDPGVCSTYHEVDHDHACA